MSSGKGEELNVGYEEHTRIVCRPRQTDVREPTENSVIS